MAYVYGKSLSMKMQFTKSLRDLAIPLLVTQLILRSRKAWVFLQTLLALCIHLVAQGAEKPTYRPPYASNVKQKEVQRTAEWTQAPWLPRVAGTLTFSGPDGEALGNIVNDGMGGSTDIDGIVYEIFAKDQYGITKTENWYISNYFGNYSSGYVSKKTARQR
jgi:hypothetical protein